MVRDLLVCRETCKFMNYWILETSNYSCIIIGSWCIKSSFTPMRQFHCWMPEYFLPSKYKTADLAYLHTFALPFSISYCIMSSSVDVNPAKMSGGPGKSEEPVASRSKAFINWINLSLSSKSITISNLTRDLESGTVLIHLLECLAPGKKMPGR